MNSSPSTAAVPARTPAQILCVLGMHRSGTSCLTGSLEEAGLYLGDRHTWNPFNRKGNRENQQVVDLNDRILADNDAAWDRPPGGEVRWQAARSAAALALLAGYADHSLFGFKDPRTLLVLDGWKRLFPQMRFIGIFRDPGAVARSLRNRDDMPLEQGLALWQAYNRLLLREYRRAPFALLCFDHEQALFQQKLRQVLVDLGFDGGNWRAEFYDGELKSAESGAKSALPWGVRRLYRKLQRLAV